MHALIEISDKQFLVKLGDKVIVPRQQAVIGEIIDIKPLMQVNQEQSSMTPSGTVQVKVLEHFKGEKLIVFKKKRRKRYQKRNSHRQLLTQVEVLSV